MGECKAQSSAKTSPYKNASVSKYIYRNIPSVLNFIEVLKCKIIFNAIDLRQFWTTIDPIYNNRYNISIGNRSFLTMLRLIFIALFLLAAISGYLMFISKPSPASDKGKELVNKNKVLRTENNQTKNNRSELTQNRNNGDVLSIPLQIGDKTSNVTSNTAYPELRQGVLPDEDYFYAIQRYMDARLKEELVINPKLKIEYEKTIAYKASGYMEYDNPTLFALVENGDTNAAIVLLIMRNNIEKSKRLPLLKLALKDKSSFVYHIYATNFKSRSPEEREAYLTVAYQLGSEMSGFNLKLNAESRKANGFNIDQQKLEEYIIIAKTKFQFD